MSKSIVNSDKAPLPIGPYNQANLANGTLYISGQVALDPVEKKIIAADIAEETNIVLTNIGAILEAAGMTYRNVVKCTVFVMDIGNFGKINAEYSRYFDPEWAPARELVEVSKLPAGANIEISAIAVQD